MKSVLKAVLLDTEALRFVAPEAGRLKDPILHVIGLARGIGARITDPNQFMWNFSNLSERVLTAPTVFSFFSPLGTLPGQPNLFAPEFQIYPAALAIQRANFIYGILAGWYGASFSMDLTPYQAVASNPATLVNKVDHTLMLGRMSPTLRQTLVTATTAVPSSNTRERALGALYSGVESRASTRSRLTHSATACKRWFCRHRSPRCPGPASCPESAAALVVEAGVGVEVVA